MNKNTELVKRTQVEGTPFTIITTPDGGSIITMGIYRISEPMENEEKAEKYIKEKPWNLLLSVIMVAVEEEIKKEMKNTLRTKLEGIVNKTNGNNEKEN